MQDDQIKNILIVKNRAMGDGIMGLSSVRYLRDLYPKSKIIYGVPSWVAPLFLKTRNDADIILPIKLESFNDFVNLWKNLHEYKVDLIFEMHQAGRTAKFFSFYSFMSLGKCQYYFHNHHLSSGTKVLDQGVIKSVIQRDLDGVFSFMAKDKSAVPNYLDYGPKLDLLEYPVNSEEYKIIIGVVATRETKMWGVDNYVSLIKLIYSYFHDTNRVIPKIIIPLSKSREDEALKLKISERLDSDYYQIEQVSLAELPGLIAGAKLYIGNDTGLKHLAVALGVKSYTLFGPEPPNEWHPYDKEKHIYFYKEDLDCRTLISHYCGLSTCSSMICLNEFTPDFVFLKIRKDLNSWP